MITILKAKPYEQDQRPRLEIEFGSWWKRGVCLHDPRSLWPIRPKIYKGSVAQPYKARNIWLYTWFGCTMVSISWRPAEPRGG